MEEEVKEAAAAAAGWDCVSHIYYIHFIVMTG